MPKAKRFTFTEGQDPARVARVQGIRQSSAAGVHSSVPRRERSRGAARRSAIARGY